jgi:subtilisin family serine protease
MNTSTSLTFLGRFRWLLALLLAGATLQMPAFAQVANSGSDDPAVPAEILLRLRSTAALGPLLTRHQLILVSQFGARPIYRLRTIGTADVNAKLADLLLEPGVLIAERNALHKDPESRRNSPWAIGSAANYQAQWAPAALRLAQAHLTGTGTGVRVAVLDTGVDARHPLLAGRLLPGYDFVDGDNDPGEVGSALTSSAYGHGTHVAGLVALVAPGARIMPLRVLDAAGFGNAWVLGEALLHAANPDGVPGTDDGAHVINLSLGSLSRTKLLDTLSRLASCSLPEALEEATDDFTDPGFNDDKERCRSVQGAVIVAAAGNDASRSIRQYPAAEGVYGLLAVTASDADNRIASFANSGNWIAVAAPGEGITSSVPGGIYGTWSGTSMAAPLVAGVAALVRAQAPALSAKDLARRIVRNAGTLCGTRIPRVDAVAALGLTAAPPAVCR